MHVSDEQDRPRVLLLLRGGAMNGCQRQMRYLIEGLAPEGYEPVAVAPHREGALEALADLGVETHRLPMRDWRRFPEALGRPLDERRLRRLAEGRGVSLVHGADFWKGRYAIQLGRALGIPSVVHVRGPFQRRDVHKHKLHHASALIAIAERYADDLAAVGVPAERIATIDDAVDTSAYRPPRPGDDDVLGSAADVTRRGEGVRVGLVGRIEPFKRQREFIEMIAPVARALPRDAVTFYLVGPAPAEPYRQRVAAAIERHGVADRVVLTAGRRTCRR